MSRLREKPLPAFSGVLEEGAASGPGTALISAVPPSSSSRFSNRPGMGRAERATFPQRMRSSVESFLSLAMAGLRAISDRGRAGYENEELCVVAHATREFPRLVAGAREDIAARRADDG
ncbi:hypothetical protein ACVMB3_001500 [Sinorhizobium meliloti]